MLQDIRIFIRKPRFAWAMRELYRAVYILTAAALVLLLITQISYAGADPDSPQGETLEDWQAMICGPDVGDVWSIDGIERTSHNGSGTLHPAGLWPGGWVDGYEPGSSVSPLTAPHRDHPVDNLHTDSDSSQRTVPPIPVPYAFYLLGTSMLCLALLRRKR